MTDQEVAADHLKIIRSLMERATIYRAISAPAAIFGGIIALGVGIVMALQAPLPATSSLSEASGPTCSSFSYLRLDPEGTLAPLTFFLIWVGVLALVGLFNSALLWRDSKRRGENFLSSGMKLAVRATLPPMLAGGIISFILLEAGGSRTTCALLWVIFYSLALLAARSFAPRSMRWLGWMFFCAGIGLFVILRFANCYLEGKFATDQAQAGIVMALTFGALHLVYAFIIFCRSPKGEEPV